MQGAWHVQKPWLASKLQCRVGHTPVWDSTGEPYPIALMRDSLRALSVGVRRHSSHNPLPRECMMQEQSGSYGLHEQLPASKAGDADASVVSDTPCG
jgi:hypothetical protein